MMLSTSPVLLALIASVGTFLLTALGALFIFFTDSPKRNVITFTESFASGIMLAASYFSLLAPAINCETQIPVWFVVSFSFLLGGTAVVVLEYVLDTNKTKKSKLMYLSVSAHNVPEGLSVGVAFLSGNVISAFAFAFGIGIQNVPEGYCVAVPFRQDGYSKRKSFLYSALSGAIEIPSAVIGAMLSVFSVSVMPWALSLAAGAMVAVTCLELLPESLSENKLLSVVGLFLGFTLMMILDVAL